MSDLTDFLKQMSAGEKFSKDKLYATAVSIAASDDYSLYRNIHRAAKRKECEPVTPRDHELQLDLDSEEAWEYFKARFENISKDLENTWISEVPVEQLASVSFIPPSYTWYPSKSGLPKRHVTVSVPGKQFSDMERVAWQYVLGDDPVRGAMNFRRVLLGIPDPFVLFKPLDNDRTHIVSHPSHLE